MLFSLLPCFDSHPLRRSPSLLPTSPVNPSSPAAEGVYHFTDSFPQKNFRFHSLPLLKVFSGSPLHLYDTHLSSFCFPLPILYLTPLISHFVPDVILPFPSFCFLASLQELSCSSLSLHIQPTAHVFVTFLPEQGMKQELVHFLLLIFSFCPQCGDATTYSSNPSVPCSLQTPDQRVGVKSCNSSDHETFYRVFTEKVKAGDLVSCTFV